MKKMKKLSAALLAVVMMVSMLSCMVLNVSAASVKELGGPVSIKSFDAAGGIAVGGKTLPNGILVVDDNWADCEAGQKVQIVLGGAVYSGYIGVNAFAEISEAALVLKSNYTIYVAPGCYSAAVSMPGCSNVKIYGPQAGVNPNNKNDIAQYNTKRPAANIEDTSIVSADPDAYNEAVFTGVINVCTTQYRPSNFVTYEGFYFADTAYLFLSNARTYFIAPQMRNNIFSVSSSYIMNLDKTQTTSSATYYGQNTGILFEDNRVLKGKTIMAIGGFMDCTVRNNYLNLSPYKRADGLTEKPSAAAVYISSFYYSSATATALVEGNYFENCSGIVRHDRGEEGFNSATYSIQVRNNRIAKVEPGTYLIRNRFYAMKSLPGINIHFTGNTVEKIPTGTTLFQLPYNESQYNLSRYRYHINITNNSFDLPVASPFVDSEMAGVINATNNTFKNGITMSQIAHEDDCDVLLYPYFDGTGKVVGAAKIQGVREMILDKTYSGSVNEADKKVTYDLTGSGLNKVNLNDILILDDGCTFKVFKEATLETEVESDAVYLDGHETVRYILVISPDGAGIVYSMLITREYGEEAELLDVTVSATDVMASVSRAGADKYIVNIKDADLAFLKYDLHVSAGASVELYEDYATKKKLTDIGDYIPYDGYTIDVLVKAEFGSAENLYTLQFNRTRSKIYDPSIIGIKSHPESQWALRPLDGLWLYYFCEGFRKELTFDFVATPGATYTVYSDAAMTKKVSASNGVKALKLAAGVNTFYIKVVDSAYTNVVRFEVVNEEVSSDASIEGILGNQPTIVDNTISLVIGGNTTSVSFLTGNEFAVCDVYADEACKLAVKANESLVPDLNSDRVVKTRSFSLETVHSKSIYYVICTAEDGKTTQKYKLILSKLAIESTYADVAEGAWYTPYVATATTEGILLGEQGEGGQIFRPEDHTTREEIAVIMSRLTGINGAAYADVALGYKDEAAISDWAKNYVKVCKQNGLMGGSGEADGVYFFPANSITREEVMVIFARLFNLTGKTDLSSFKDAKSVSSWAKASVEAVVASGLITGDNGNLKPQDRITRAEIATIVTRALEYAE